MKGLNDGLMKEKEDEIKKGSAENKPKPLKKLKPIPQNAQKKTPEPEKKTPAKKRIVIGELPDYDSLAEEETKKEESKSEPEKKNEKEKQSEKPEKKNFFARVKDLMYVSAEDEEEENDEEEAEEKHTKIEIPDIPDEEDDVISFTIDEMIEDAPDTMDIVNEVLAESKSPKSEKPEQPEKKQEEEKEPEAKEPEKKPQQAQPKNNNSSKNKKKKNKKKNRNKNSGAGNSAKPEQSEKKQEEAKEPEKIKEPEIVEPEPEIIPEPEPEPETVPEQEEITEEVAEEIPEIPAETEKPEKSDGTAFMIKNGKYGIPVLLCIVLAIIGIIAIINTLISGGGSSNDKYKKAIYPAVITDISPFEDPSELSDNQILSSAIWSVILDSEKLEQYPQRIDNMAIIPAEDVENIAKEIFGEDLRELAHSTITTADSKFYYNDEANSYSVDIKPYTFTYSPKINSVSKKKGKYIVEVDYIAEHPEWMEEGVSKSAEFILSKNDSDGYIIDSMREIIPE